MALISYFFSPRPDLDVSPRAVLVKERFVNYVWPIAFFCAVVLSRTFAIFCNQEINVDESLMLEQVLRYQRDLIPWRAVDGLTSGPINTWALSIAHGFGMPLTFRAAHAFAAILLGGVVSGGFVLARRSFGFPAALIAGMTAVFWSALVQSPDFTHYSSELVPIALLTGALLLLTAENRGRRASLFFSASGGLAIGLMPWAKLQSAPIAIIVGLWFFVFKLWLEKPNRPWSRGLAFTLGAVTPSAVILSMILAGGVWPVFWRSYIISNLAYAGQKSVGKMIHDARKLLLAEAVSPWLLLVVIGLMGWLLSWLRDQPAKFPALPKATYLAGLLLISASFVCVRPITQFGHYTLFLLLPLILSTAALFQTGNSPRKHLFNPGVRRRIGLTLWVLAWLVYGGWHARTTHAQLFDLYRIRSRQADAAGVITKLRDVEPQFGSVEVWGWFPSIYVQLAQPAPTRYGIPHMLYTRGPARDFLRQTYLADLIQAKPNVVLKMNGVIDQQWTSDPGFFPELGEYIANHYELRWTGQTPFYSNQASLEIYVRRQAMRLGSGQK